MRFLSPHDGEPMLLTPEHSISLQNSIGADIMMQLDDVVSSLTTGARVEEVFGLLICSYDRQCFEVSGGSTDALQRISILIARICLLLFKADSMKIYGDDVVSKWQNEILQGLQ